MSSSRLCSRVRSASRRAIHTANRTSVPMSEFISPPVEQSTDTQPRGSRRERRVRFLRLLRALVARTSAQPSCARTTRVHPTEPASWRHLARTAPLSHPLTELESCRVCRLFPRDLVLGPYLERESSREAFARSPSASLRFFVRHLRAPSRRSVETTGERLASRCAVQTPYPRAVLSSEEPG